MASGPTYITRSKHGVYYFQLRAGDLLKKRLGLTGKLFRKSLRTKTKAVALARARLIWLLLYENDFLKQMANPSNTPSPEEQALIIAEEREVDRILSAYIKWQQGYDAIHPNDLHTQQQYLEIVSHWINITNYTEFEPLRNQVNMKQA